MTILFVGKQHRPEVYLFTRTRPARARSPMSSLSLEAIEAALLEGLGYRRGAMTETATRRLARTVSELAKVPELELQVLRECRKLWDAENERQPLTLRALLLAYPDLDRVSRKSRARSERLERERLERHAEYAGVSLQ